MFFPIALVALAAPFLVSAAPVPLKRASGTDALVFQFAGVLEALETQFYQQALQKFQATDYQSAGYGNGQLPIQLITAIQGDEATHLAFLQSALPAVGSAAVQGCNFNFDAALKDVPTFAATARVIENVGVAAYLGGAALIDDPQLVDAAATILTVEARHQTVLNILSKSGTSIPQPFDIPLTPNEVLALAGPFISGCSLDGLTANQALTVTNTNVQPGTQLNFQSNALNGSVDTSKFSCQIMTGGVATADVLPFNQCVVPQNVNGPIAVWITSDSTPLDNNVIKRATDKQVAGPAMVFVDSQPEMIGMLVAGNSGSTGSTAGSGTGTAGASVTTTTITPDQAQAIIASASASSAGAQATPNNAAVAPTVNNTPHPTTGEDGPGSVNGVTQVTGDAVNALQASVAAEIAAQSGAPAAGAPGATPAVSSGTSSATSSAPTSSSS